MDKLDQGMKKPLIPVKGPIGFSLREYEKVMLRLGYSYAYCLRAFPLVPVKLPGCRQL